MSETREDSSRTRIIGICGYKGSGKSTLARAIQAGINAARAEKLREGDPHDYSFRPVAEIRPLAQPMKELLVNQGFMSWGQAIGSQENRNELTNVRFADLKTTESTEREFMSAREVMQQFGTDVVRAQWPDFWLDCLMNKITRETEMNSNPEFVLVDDLRFKNEAQRFRDNGGYIIRVNRPDEKPTDDHATEMIECYGAEHVEVYNETSIEDLLNLGFTIGTTLVRGTMLYGVMFSNDTAPYGDPEDLPTIPVPAYGGV